MEHFIAFIGAALPWIAMGLLLAMFFARSAGHRNGKEKLEVYRDEGIAFGMCLGIALATALHFNVCLGIVAGMLLGLIAGPAKEKKNDDHSGGSCIHP